LKGREEGREEKGKEEGKGRGEFASLALGGIDAPAGIPPLLLGLHSLGISRAHCHRSHFMG